MDVDTVIRRAGPADGLDAVCILCDGFAADPVLSWVFGAEDDRVLPAFFDFLVCEAAIRAGGTYMSRDCCAVWTPGGRDPWKSGDLSRRFRSKMLRHLSADAFMRLTGLNSVTGSAHPEQPHWYLGMLATRRRAHGRGLGSAMIEHTLAFVDHDGYPSYLEATDPANVGFYERFGFVVREQITAIDSPPIILMWRPAADKN